jgi:AICAR transformylase/IMP cyclohydrolase PurH
LGTSDWVAARLGSHSQQVNDVKFAAPKVRLFKIVTVKDDIVVGMDEEQMSRLQAKDAAGNAQALVQNQSIWTWQYRVRTGETGLQEQLPHQMIAILASQTVRVEPYVTLLKVYPPPTQARLIAED